MKSFYTILCLFAVMMGAITINYFYISRLSQELTFELEHLPPPSESPDTAGHAHQLRDRWVKSRRFAQITVNHTEIEAISNAADELCIYAEHKSDVEFERARKLFINALEELELSEKLSPTNIL